MTDIDSMIDSMPAGPEMDRMVAERVLRWKHGFDYDDYRWGRPFADHAMEWWEDDDGLSFRPSTELAHAWAVVRTMINDERLPRLECVAMDMGGKEWAAAFEAQEARDHHAPTAICRAALKAVIK